MKEPALAKDLEREVAALADRRAFGLNFERHVPEAVELPGRKVRKGDKVRVLPPRGHLPKKSDEKLWRVIGIDRSAGEARLEALAEPVADSGEPMTECEGRRETKAGALEDLVVVAEFRDPIYPGLVSTGKVERGGDKPFHTVINAENFHALQTLLFTHRGRIDCIYIDPPYNTGARDWKYNNDYVEGDDLYRHSKWLAFIERRVQLAKELLRPEDSVLIVTIDEKEYLRLGLLLEQTFPEAEIQMVSAVINRAGSSRSGRFARVDEYILFAYFGASKVTPWVRTMLDAESDGELPTAMPTVWFTAIRRGTASAERDARPNLFYPVFIDAATGVFRDVGKPLSLNESRTDVKCPRGTIALWPVTSDGREQTWRFSATRMSEFFAAGTARLGKRDPATGDRPITYLQPGTIANIENGTFVVTGKTAEGALELSLTRAKHVTPRTVWNQPSHFARDHGSSLLNSLLGEKRFDFPKSLYAVEDAIRFFVAQKPEAMILDFFAGSGTTAHAVMRLNRQDGSRRQSISITNNEVAADEQKALREQGLRPGEPDWEKWGICDYVTKARVEAATTGEMPDGRPIQGHYKFTDEFPMADGFEENVEFFTLTYEAPLRVASNREFAKIAPLLWIRAGSRGRRIDDITAGWDVAETYGVLANLDHTEEFLKAVAASESVGIAFIVTDEERLFESVAQNLPDRVEPVRLYEAYLRNFEIESGRGSL